MYRVVIFLFIIFYPGTAAFSQSYDAYVNRAMDLYKNNQYEASTQFWEKAFNVHKGYSADYYNAACTFALSGKSNLAMDYLRKAVKAGWTNIDWLKKDSDLSSLHDLKGWEKFLNRIPEIRENYLNSLKIVEKQYSEIFEEERILKIHLPENYDENQRYPVIYTLDGDELFEITTDYVKYLNKYNVIPECIVVGIFHNDRNYETTPNYGYNTNVPTDEFLEGTQKLKNYLFKEVVPHITSKFPTSGYNVLVGHSNTATFVNQIIVEKDNPFRGLIAMSPDLLKSQVETFENYLKTKKAKSYYYFVSSGKKDAKSRLETGINLGKVFMSTHNENFKEAHEIYNAGHLDLIVKSLNDALIFVFSDYRNFNDFPEEVIENKLSIQEYLKGKYNSTSKDYGIEFKLSEADYYYLLDLAIAEKNPKLLGQLFEVAEKKSFLSGNEKFSSKAQTYEAAGLYEEALKNWKLQIEKGFNDNVFYYLRPFKLIYEKLNKPKEAINFLETSITKYPKGKLIFNYYIAKVCAEKGIMKEKGLKSINYCITNFEENRKFNLSDAKEIKNVLKNKSTAIKGTTSIY